VCMCVYVCVYVCMCVCMYVCMYVCVCTYVRTYACMHVCIYAVYLCMYACMSVYYVRVLHLYVRVCMCVTRLEAFEVDYQLALSYAPRMKSSRFVDVDSYAYRFYIIMRIRVHRNCVKKPQTVI
jgi:hypothetical protein